MFFSGRLFGSHRHALIFTATRVAMQVDGRDMPGTLSLILRLVFGNVAKLDE